MAELVGDAYIRITADTRAMDQALAKQMKRAGKNAAGEYVHAFSDEVERVAGQDARRAQTRLAKGIVDPKEFDRMAKEFDKVEDAAKSFNEKLTELRKNGHIATGETAEYRKAIKAWEQAAIAARNAAKKLNDEHFEALGMNRQITAERKEQARQLRVLYERDHGLALKMIREEAAARKKASDDQYKMDLLHDQALHMRAKEQYNMDLLHDQAIRLRKKDAERNLVAEERLRVARRKAALEEGGFFGKRAKQIDKLGVLTAKAFGKGKRNNFLNAIGGVVGGVIKVATVPLGLLAKAVDGIVDTFMVGFKSMGDSAGFFTKLGGGFSSLGTSMVGLLANWPLLLGALAAAAAGLGLLTTILPGLVSLIALMTTAVVSLAGAITYGLVAALLAAAPAIAGLAAGMGAVGLAFYSFFKDKKNKQYIKEWKAQFTGFGKEFQTPVKEFLTSTSKGFKELFKDITPSVTAFFSSWKKNMGDKSTKKGLGEWSNSLGRIATTFNSALPNLLSGVIGFFRPILPYAEKLATAIGNAFKNFDKWANSKPGQNAIADFMKTAWADAKLVWDILVQIAGIVGSVFDFGEPTGSGFLKDIDGWLKGIKEKLDDPANKGKIEGWFANAKQIGEDIGKIAGGLGDAVGALASPEGQADAKKFMDNLAKIAENAVIISDAIVAIGKTSGLGAIMSLFGADKKPEPPKKPLPGQGPAGSGTSATVVPRPALTGLGGQNKIDQVLNYDVKFKFNGVEIPSGGLKAAASKWSGLPEGKEAELAGFKVPIMADTKEYDKTVQLIGAYFFTGKQVPVDGNETQWNAVKGTVAGYAFDPKTVKIDADASDLSSAIASAKKWLSTLPKSKTIRIAGVNSTGGITLAAGGVFDQATPAIIGEAGREAVVPLDRPLSMVDPSVRSMSAVLQAMTGGRGAVGGAAGPKVNFEAGAFNINLPTGDPQQAAEAVLDRLVAYIG